MKFLLIALAMLASAVPVRAQDAAGGERDRIRAARAAAESAYAGEERACYDRFLVNDCLDKARMRRDDALADLRRQELALNEEARRRRAQDRQREIDERSSPERLEAAERRRQDAVAARREREAAQAEQAARRASDAAGRTAKSTDRRDPGAPAPAAAVPPHAPAAGGGAVQNKPSPPGDAARNRAEHEARVKEAADRKARVLQRKADRAKPAASGLPPPS